MIGVEMFKTMLVTLAGAAAVSFAGVAHADNGPFSGPQGDHDVSAYWVDVSSFGSGSMASAAGLASAICLRLTQGASEGQLIAALAQPPYPTPVPDATFIVHAAEWHFCPTYY
jgi:hypothetical protein